MNVSTFFVVTFSTDSVILDPNAPKRGLSAYMFFANEQRENVRNDNPGIAFGKFPRVHITF